MSRLLPFALVVALPVTAGAQSVDFVDGASWQPSWRFGGGVVALGSGAALLSLSLAYGQYVLSIEDRAVAASEAAESTTSQADLVRLSRRIERLNHQGSELETRHLVTLVSGALLFATGVALVVWDWLRTPDPLTVTVSPSGVAVRLDW